MAYIGQSLVEGTRRVYNYTATASQTTFHAVYQVGVVDVYKNGLLLAPDTYTATDGANIVLDTGASAGDTIAIHCHNTFSVTDTVPASGGSFTGDVTMQGNLNVQGTTTTLDSASAQTVDLGDNDKIRLGDGNDLEIYHDGSNSNIKDAGTGPLKIFATDLYINNSAGNKTHISGIDGGAVTLFHNGASKLATTSTGVDVTGTVTPDSISIGGGTTASYKKLVIESSSDAAGIGLNGGTGTGVDYEIQSGPSGNFLFYDRSNTRYLYDATGTSHDWYIDGSVGMHLNSNGGLSINSTVTPVAYIDVRVPAASTYQSALNLSNGSNADIQFRIQNSLSMISPSTGTPLALGVGNVEKVRLNANGSLTLKQTSGVGALQINSGDNTSQTLGNVQIALGYNGEQNYQHYIATRHNSSTDDNNSIDFYISQGNQNTAFPSDTRHVLRLDGRGIVQTPAQIGFSAKSNQSSYSTTSDTQTINVFASSDFNRGNHFNTSTSVFTAPVAGLYHFTAAGRWETGTFVQNSYIRWFLSKNDGNFNSANAAQINGSNEAWGNYMAMSCSATVYLAANDTMRVKGGMNGGTAKLHSESYFTGVLLG